MLSEGHPRRGRRLVFLPPYGPDLNPIEQVFAKLKILLRKVEERNVDGEAQYSGSDKFQMAARGRRSQIIEAYMKPG